MFVIKTILGVKHDFLRHLIVAYDIPPHKDSHTVETAEYDYSLIHEVYYSMIYKTQKSLHDIRIESESIQTAMRCISVYLTSIHSAFSRANAEPRVRSYLQVQS